VVTRIATAADFRAGSRRFVDPGRIARFARDERDAGPLSLVRDTDTIALDVPWRLTWTPVPGDDNSISREPLASRGAGCGGEETLDRPEEGRR
jgi:hypothetical protein